MAKDRKVQGAGFQLIISSGSVSEKVQAAILSGLEDVTSNYKKQVIKNISLTDHDLKDLRELGYPYARGKPEDFPHDDRMVHIQEGVLKRGIHSNPPEQITRNRFEVFITSSAPETPFLLYGTKTMRPRRFHQKAYEEIKERFWSPITDRLKKVSHRIASVTRTK